jgi:hypothetical protein
VTLQTGTIGNAFGLWTSGARIDWGEDAVPSIGKSQINGKKRQEKEFVVNLAQADSVTRQGA